MIWTEEAGVDGVELYREFLSFAVENVVNSPTHLFSASRSAFFSSFPVHILAKNIYFIMSNMCTFEFTNWESTKLFPPLITKSNI